MGIREANIPVRGNPVEAQKGELMWQRPTVGLWVGAEVACWEGMMEESWALIADTVGLEWPGRPSKEQPPKLPAWRQLSPEGGRDRYLSLAGGHSRA